MSEQNKTFTGSAKQLDTGNAIIELNITQLKRALARPDIQQRVKSFPTKNDGEQQIIKVFMGKVKEPSKYRTHYLKVIDWDNEPETQTNDGWP